MNYFFSVNLNSIPSNKYPRSPSIYLLDEYFVTINPAFGNLSEDCNLKKVHFSIRQRN